MKFALHSISYTNTWEGQVKLGIEKVINKTAEMGFDGIEIVAKRPHISPLDYSKEDRNKLKELIFSKGLEIPCIAGYNDFGHDPNHMDMARLEKEILWLRETVDIAVDLEAPIVRVFSAYLIPGISRYQQWKWVVQGLKESCRYAEEKGVDLALQNHSELTINYFDVLRMVDEVGSNNLKIEIDAPYLAMTEDCYEKVVKEVGNLLVYTVASDHKEISVPMNRYPSTLLNRDNGYFKMVRNHVVPVGKGDVDYRSFFKSLLEIGYDGFVGYEVCSPIEGGGSEENIDRVCSESLKYMKELVAELSSNRNRVEKN